MMNDEAVKLACGHEPRGGRWVTIFYPNPDASYRRFCDIECMTWWHEQQQKEMRRQFWQEEVPQLLEAMDGEDHTDPTDKG